MIDRKALWTLILFALVMTAAALWRLSLLPDWTQVPFTGPRGPFTRHGLVLFIPPLSMLFLIVLSWIMKYMVSGTDVAIAAYQRLNRKVLLGVAVLSLLMHGYIISRSLGYGLALHGEYLARGTVVITAILVMFHGNALPKLPWLSSRITSFQFDAWQSARSRRFAGRISIVLSLGMIAAGLLMPIKTVAPFVMALSLAYLVAIIWYALKLKREPSVTA